MTPKIVGAGRQCKTAINFSPIKSPGECRDFLIEHPPFPRGVQQKSPVIPGNIYTHHLDLTGAFCKTEALADADVELVAPSGDNLATDGALDIIESVIYLVLFDNITGNQSAGRPQDNARN